MGTLRWWECANRDRNRHTVAAGAAGTRLDLFNDPTFMLLYLGKSFVYDNSVAMVRCTTVRIFCSSSKCAKSYPLRCGLFSVSGDSSVNKER